MKLDQVLPFDDYLAAGDHTAATLIKRNDALVDLIRETHQFIGDVIAVRGPELRPVPSLLALNAFMLFDAGAQLAVCGNVTAIHAVMRTAVESACYAFLIGQSPDLERIWLERHRDDDSMRSCRREFGQAVAAVVKALEERQKGAGAWINDLYQASIDFGAHPNTRSITSNLRIEDRDEGAFANLAGLYGADAFETRRGLLAASEYGYAVASIVLASGPVDGGEELAARAAALHARKEEIVDREFHRREETAGPSQGTSGT